MVPLHAQLAGQFAQWAVESASRIGAWILERRLRSVFLLLVMGASLAIGQASPEETVTPMTPTVQTNTASSYTFNREGLAQQIVGVVQQQLDRLRNNSTIKAFGDFATAFFLCALLIWTTLKTMATGKGFGELIGEWVPIFVAFGVVFLLLNRDVGNQIVSSMDSVAGSINSAGAGPGGSGESLRGNVMQVTNPIFAAISAVVDQPRVTEGASTSGVGGFFSGWIAGAASALMGVVAKLGTVFIIIVAGVILLAHVIIAFISVALVLALAPLMVPFLMFRPLEWIFNSWLKFLLGACMLKIVAAFLLSAVAGLLAGMSSFATQVAAEARGAQGMEALQTDIVLLGLMVVFALLGALVMAQAPSIANGLLSGMGGHGFSGLKGFATGAGGGALNSGVRGASAGGLQAIRNTIAARAGANHAIAGSPSRAAGIANTGSRAAYSRGYIANRKPPPAPAAPTSVP